MKKQGVRRGSLVGFAAVMLLGYGRSVSASTFEDVTEVMGFSSNLAVSGMAEWCDVNRDGWVDLYSAGSMWMNMQGEYFEAMTNLPGQMSGAGTWGDYDNDGYPDFFNFRNQKLFHNDGGTGFSNVSDVLPTIASMESRGAAWGDFNNSGFLDLYIGGFEDWDNDITYPDIVLMNRNGEFFEQTWEEAKYRARGVIACDFDQDHDLDIYVSNYRLFPNVLRVNDGYGVFVDKAAEYNVVSTETGYSGAHSIGSCWGDLDNDGLFDLFSGNFSHPNSSDLSSTQPQSDFFRNLGPSYGYHFEDLGPCDVPWQESYASPALGDFNNDGFQDLFLTTVYATGSYGIKNYSVLMRNNGDWTFTDRTVYSNIRDIIGGAETYQAAWADFNNDGQLDLVSGGRLMRNNGNNKAWFEVRLTGSGRVNTSAIGAQVRLYSGDSVYTRQVASSTGQGNENSPTLHFGLGDAPVLPMAMTVLWPDGTEQKMTIREVNRILSVSKETVRESDSALLTETFEVADQMNAGSIQDQKGWGVTGGTNAVVQTDVVAQDRQALELRNSAVWHQQNQPDSNIWIRFQAQLSGAPESLPAITDPAGMILLVNTNRHILVYSNSLPVELDAQLPLNQWVQFDLYCNFNTTRWMLGLNGTNVADNLIFDPSFQDRLIGFASQNSSPLYIDQVEVSDKEPSGGLPDFDADGVPDWWEMEYSGSITGIDANAVSPNSGLSFLRVYIAGADPTADTALRISKLPDARGLSWTPQIGRLYDVEWTDNLQSSFICIATNVPAAQSRYVDYDALEGFYRLKARMAGD